MMASRIERAEERLHARHALERLISADSLIFTRTDYGRGESDYVRIYVIAPEPGDDAGRPAIVDVSDYAARMIGAKMTPRGIRRAGGQYHKGIDTADLMMRAVFDASLNQHNHREIH